MSKKLQKIKKQVEKEWNSSIRDFIKRDQYVTLDQILDQVAQRFSDQELLSYKERLKAKVDISMDQKFAEAFKRIIDETK